MVDELLRFIRCLEIERVVVLTAGTTPGVEVLSRDDVVALSPAPRSGRLAVADAFQRRAVPRDGTVGRTESVAPGCSRSADADEELAGFDAAAMIETIEHIPAGELSKLEHSVFVKLRPKLVIITTPNREYNALYGLGEDESRRDDHEFEWSRSKFAYWAWGVGDRTGFRVTIGGIGRRDPLLGNPTQLAVFRSLRTETRAEAGEPSSTKHPNRSDDD